ncbi:MAG: Lrp/AsnC family transcriptional regulator [Rhodospirillaceae bacterium]
MTPLDRAIINGLQGGFPLTERPFADAAEGLGIQEIDLVERLRAMLDDGTLTRFGPLWDPVALGGAVTLAAMSVPDDRFDAVAEAVNAFPEVAHNYARDHALNMWFVAADSDEAALARTLERIAAATGLEVLSFPKEREYFLELKLEA